MEDQIAAGHTRDFSLVSYVLALAEGHTNDASLLCQGEKELRESVGRLVRRHPIIRQGDRHPLSQAKVDQVGEQAGRNDQSIEDTKNQLKQVDDKAQSGISAAQEKAPTADPHAQTADQHAGDAMNKANQVGQAADQAGQSADQANRGPDSLRQVVANIDDYKLQLSATVAFKFNKSLLTEAQEDLDKLAEGVKSSRRFFMAVEGYTDDVGNKQYNELLSRQRADSVAEYLVAEHDIPIYHIHMIGLGEEKPVDEGHNREARAKNRRVEVKIFTADQVTASLGGSDLAAR